MKDPRIIELAKNVVNYSISLKPGEKVLIESRGLIREFTDELINQVYITGGIPFVNITDRYIERGLLMGATKEQMEMMAKYEILKMKDMDAYIGIGAPDNANEQSDVPDEKMNLYMKYFWSPLNIDHRIPNTKWVAMRYPTEAMAQSAGMSTQAFEDFYFNICNLNYEKMSRAMDPLVKLMEETDKVRIKGVGTDLEFSIKNIPVEKCDGKLNIPDGEVCTAPVKNSVNGIITYNTPAVYQGYTYENISFEFKEGKIVKAVANNTEKINYILDTDEGARYIGEFAIGVNPYIEKPMKETLFDEKIKGSIHFTPGNCMAQCNNGNRSSIHWDLVYIQTPEYGGGEIWFDDRLIRKDGRFVIEELEPLNPENLI